MAISTFAVPSVLLVALTGLLAVDDELTVAKLEEVRDEVLADVEELRGGKFARPVAVKVTDREGFFEYALARTEATQSEDQRLAEEQAAKLLGLIPSDMSLQDTMFEFMEEQVGGFYEPSEETFYVVSSFSEPGVLRVILVHELTHALDDQLFGIDDKLIPLSKVNSDATLAFHAVVEGSGTSVMNRWMLPKIMNGEISMADIMAASPTPDFGDLEEYIWLPLLHSYLRGAAFLGKTDNVMAGAMANPDSADIDRAFENPPVSTEQILHPEKYWDEEQLDVPHTIKFDLSNLPEGWELLKSDTLGELGMSLVTRAPEARQTFTQFPEFTSEIGAGWGGDRYVLLGKGNSRVLYSVSSWDSDIDRDEFSEALSGLSAHFEAGAKKFGDGAGGFIVEEQGENARTVQFTVWSGVEGAGVGSVLKSIDTTVTINVSK